MFDPISLCSALLYLGFAGGPNVDEDGIACRYVEDVVIQSERNGIEPETLSALIYIESRWNPNAISNAGACGLTQVLPQYTGSPRTGVPSLTCSDLRKPRTSIMAGARTLSFWLKRKNNNLERALCHYNSGNRCTEKGRRYAQAVLDVKEDIQDYLNEVSYHDTCGPYDEHCHQNCKEPEFQVVIRDERYLRPQTRRRYWVHHTHHTKSVRVKSVSRSRSRPTRSSNRRVSHAHRERSVQRWRDSR